MAHNAFDTDNDIFSYIELVERNQGYAAHKQPAMIKGGMFPHGAILAGKVMSSVYKSPEKSIPLMDRVRQEVALALLNSFRCKDGK